MSSVHVLLQHRSCPETGTIVTSVRGVYQNLEYATWNLEAAQFEHFNDEFVSFELFSEIPVDTYQPINNFKTC